MVDVVSFQFPRVIVTDPTSGDVLQDLVDLPEFLGLSGLFLSISFLFPRALLLNFDFKR